MTGTSLEPEREAASLEPEATSLEPDPESFPRAVEPDEAVRAPDRTEGGSHAIAALLATAAVVAAIVTARASFLSSDASGNWQTALRIEVQRSAGTIEDVRYLYQTELPMAMAIAEARIRQQQFQADASTQTGAAHDALLLEASVQAALVTAQEPSSELATGTAYALPSGGFDVGRRLTDLRAGSSKIVALNPDSPQSTGDALADQASRLTIAAVPIGVCVLLGALAQPFSRWRRQLLGAGVVALLVGIVLALAAGLAG